VKPEIEIGAKVGIRCRCSSNMQPAGLYLGEEYQRGRRRAGPVVADSDAHMA